MIPIRTGQIWLKQRRAIDGSITHDMRLYIGPLIEEEGAWATYAGSRQPLDIVAAGFRRSFVDRGDRYEIRMGRAEDGYMAILLWSPT